MAQTAQIKVFYHVVRGDQVDSSPRNVRINENNDIAALRQVIATKEAVPGGFVNVWKVCPSGFAVCCG